MGTGPRVNLSNLLQSGKADKPCPTVGIALSNLGAVGSYQLFREKHAKVIKTAEELGYSLTADSQNTLIHVNGECG